MKRRYVAAIGALFVIVCIGIGIWTGHQRSQVQTVQSGPVYAYADLEHVMMSHPKYSEYHHLELEYNAMIAQYQFEQWHYSRQAVAEGKAVQAFTATDAMGSQVLDQELKAKVALKENELNNSLKQQYEQIVQEKKKSQPVISSADNLKIVNLQLKLRTLALSDEERQATQQELQALMRSAGTDVQVTNQTAADIAAAMAPYKKKAQDDLAAYAKQVKADLEKRQQNSQDLFQTAQHHALTDRPEPAVWNQEWKTKLDAKEKELKDVKEDILADIRDKAAIVAGEQKIDMIFCDYEGVGTAIDVTDDIIAKLA
ncbi:MAG: OmpH family outer membrane protein [Megasphaera sp.]|jgi:hypothetical protein|nr:OmpH family outer membrane protein [Megasphaera sp.]MCH4187103.1 OmpH family outer membrane protein [Megasphaera sp.]MCH4216961.1 OmpH family outer membrane protein [Megasphaera sp.]